MLQILQIGKAGRLRFAVAAAEHRVFPVCGDERNAEERFALRAAAPPGACMAVEKRCLSGGGKTLQIFGADRLEHREQIVVQLRQHLCLVNFLPASEQDIVCKRIHEAVPEAQQMVGQIVAHLFLHLADGRKLLAHQAKLD